ncbi:MAG: hypothetical protein NTY80_05470 [candidate division SR1 bacterium]|nr:hypothetical protein [candidate division SR1 bacterium]
MNKETFYLIGAAFGFLFIVIHFVTRRKNQWDQLSSLIVAGKQAGKSDEEIQRIVANLSRIMLESYNKLHDDPVAFKKWLKEQKKQIKTNTIVIKENKKTIVKANKFLNKYKLTINH